MIDHRVAWRRISTSAPRGGCSARPQYHRFKEEDARKEGLWEKAGYEVERIASDVVYEHPGALLALAR